MNLSGVVSPGSDGNVFPYDSNYPPGDVSFDGQPVSISMTIGGDPGSLYVQSFSASWSNQTYGYPYITSFSGTGYPQDPINDNVFGFYSTVSLTPTGGSVSIFPTSGLPVLTIACSSSNAG